jgi:hypothetical protein
VDVGEKDGTNLDHDATLMGANEGPMTAALPDDYTAALGAHGKSASGSGRCR